MADGTKIEWCTTSWNPITGCTAVSEGCQNCYAKRMANRLRGRCGYPVGDPFGVTFHPERLEQLRRWKSPRLIFVCSMADIFHTRAIGLSYTMRSLIAMKSSPQHAYLLLTKRPELAVEFKQDFADNIWLGATAENQQRANGRIPILRDIPAAHRFVSVEPMLGPVDLFPYVGLDWVIVGGETGPGARPCNPDWMRSLRDQCAEACVPFFLKQMSGKQAIPEDLQIRQVPKELKRFFKAKGGE
jgi:protein gp37